MTTNPMKDQKTKESFIKYLQDPKNKDLRFWQALRNWSKYDYVMGWSAGEFDFSKLPEGLEDTFYIENE